jgi:hypothetical protein
MIIAVHGTKNFDDYSIFLRAMGTAMSYLDKEDNEILLYTAGPYQINAMVMEFANVSERSLKARGKKIRVIKIPPKWIEQNVHEIGYFAYFSKPKETPSYLVDFADAKDVNVGVYRY